MERIELNDTLRGLLLRIPPFDALPAGRASAIPERLDHTLLRIGKGEVIARQGTACSRLFVLLEGCLRVDIIDAFGNRILVEHIQAPRVFATPHLFGADNTLPATFTALGDGVLFAATRESAFRLISEEPEILQKFLCITGNCNHCTTKRLRVLSYKGVRERLAVYLLDRATGRDSVPLVHNNSQLAEYLNVTRPALSKQINALKREGVIALDEQGVRILDRSALLEAASGCGPKGRDSRMGGR